MSTKHISPITQCTYWLTRFMILRVLGLVYLVAFLTAAKQIVPLIGANGLLPVGQLLAHVRESLGSTQAGFFRLPSLFWWNHSDATLLVTAWIGVALSVVVLCGWANALLLAALWLLYMSFVHVGQDWYRYGWEVQLLETGFFAIFLCPLLDGRPFPRRAPPLVVLWLFRWLIFGIMLGAGLIKIRGDSCWRDLTALYYHFETQPLPNPLSRWFHFLPRVLLRAGVAFNHAAELVAPWFIFGPRMARRVAGGIIILFQGTLILGGNLSFLNWLTMVPALACFDDAVWAKIVPRALTRRAEEAVATARPCRPQEAVAYAVAGVVAFLSINPVANMFSRQQIMNTSFEPLNLVNTYGAFGSVGQERLNVVFEGTDAEVPDNTAEWKEYSFKGLPVDQEIARSIGKQSMRKEMPIQEIERAEEDSLSSATTVAALLFLAEKFPHRQFNSAELSIISGIGRTAMSQIRNAPDTPFSLGKCTMQRLDAWLSSHPGWKQR